MMSGLSILLRVVLYLSVSLFVACAFDGGSGAKIGDLVNSLLAVSAMVFTMMGIWIGLIYPNLLYANASSNVAAADFEPDGDGKKRLEIMVWSVLLSGASALLILIFRFIDLFSDVMISAGCFLVAFSALLQIEALIYVIRVSVGFVSLLYAKAAR